MKRFDSTLGKMAKIWESSSIWLSWQPFSLVNISKSDWSWRITYESMPQLCVYHKWLQRYQHLLLLCTLHGARAWWSSTLTIPVTMETTVIHIYFLFLSSKWQELGQELCGALFQKDILAICTESIALYRCIYQWGLEKCPKIANFPQFGCRGNHLA